MKRRNILKGVVGGIAFGTISGTASGDEPNSRPEIDAKELEYDQAVDMLNKTKKRKGVSKMFNYMDSKGWKTSTEKITAYSGQIDGVNAETLVIPIKTDSAEISVTYHWRSIQEGSGEILKLDKDTGDLEKISVSDDDEIMSKTYSENITDKRRDSVDVTTQDSEIVCTCNGCDSWDDECLADNTGLGIACGACAIAPNIFNPACWGCVIVNTAGSGFGDCCTNECGFYVYDMETCVNYGPDVCDQAAVPIYGDYCQ